MKVTLLVLIFAGCALTAFVKNRVFYRPAFINTTSKNDARPGLKITNGIEAPPHSIPYQVFLVFHGDNDQAWSCTGSLITSQYVLTAAHCLLYANRADVYLGLHDLSKVESGSIEVQSRRLKIHESFDPQLVDNDIGLIELAVPVSPSQTIGFSRLPSRRDPNNTLVDKQGRVSGWGLTDGVANTTTSVLMQTTDNVIPNLECDAVYRVVRDEELCLSGALGNGPCRGDSGAPLVINGIQEGLFSYGTIWCIPEYPTVFVRIRSFLHWIEIYSDWRDQ